MAERQGEKLESGSMEEPLIPCLPNEVAMLCLARLPYVQYALLSCVCRSWRRTLKLPLLFDMRARLGFEEQFLFILTAADRFSLRFRTCPQFYLVDSRLAKRYPLAPPSGLRGDPYGLGCDLLALGRQVLIRPKRPWDRPNLWETLPLCFDVVSRLSCAQPPPMLESRILFASATVDGYVYAAGGLGNDLCLKSVERFDLASQKWERIPDMTEKRWYASGVAWKGSFCVFGGFHRTPQGNDIVLDSAEVWDALKEEWQLIPGIFPKDVRKLATVKGKLYALKFGDVKEVMLLDEKSNHWIPLGSLTDDLQGFAQYRLIGVGDELCMFVTRFKECNLFATDPKSLPLCWRLLPFSFDAFPSVVGVVVTL